VKFTEYNVAQDREALSRMIEVSGARTVPVIAASDDFMIGFDPERLEQLVNSVK
jgi:glutaredoxin